MLPPPRVKTVLVALRTLPDHLTYRTGSSGVWGDARRAVPSVKHVFAKRREVQPGEFETQKGWGTQCPPTLGSAFLATYRPTRLKVFATNEV